MDQLSASDLIFLYLDGEATSLQQEVLFSQLAHNQELQQEFTDALRINKAFRQERSSTKAPLYLSSKVFANAGIAYHGVEVAAGAAVVGTAWYSLQRLILPVSALFVGVLATYAALNFGSWFNDTPSLSDNSTTTSGERVQSLIGDRVKSEFSLIDDENHSFSRDTQTEPQTHRRVQQSATAENEVSDYVSANANNNVNTTIAGSMNEDASVQVDHEKTSSLDEVNSEMPAEVHAVTLSEAQFSLVSSNTLLQRTNVIDPGIIGTSSSLFTLQGNRVLHSEIFGGSSGRIGASAPSLALLVNLDNQFSLGISVGRSEFRMSDITTSGLVLENPRFNIVSAEAQWISQENVAFDSRMFTRAGIGVATLSGATFGSGSFTVGLQIPVSVFTIMPGVSLEGILVNSRVGSPLHAHLSFVTGIGLAL